MDQVIAADREHVAVTADHPHVQIGPRHRQTGGDRRRSAVDAVHAVGVHVVREPGSAADARDEHRVVRFGTEARHQHPHRREDGVVAAARAPAHLLVGGPVARLRCRRH